MEKILKGTLIFVVIIIALFGLITIGMIISGGNETSVPDSPGIEDPVDNEELGDEQEKPSIDTIPQLEISKINVIESSWGSPMIVGRATNNGQTTIYNVALEFTIYESEKKEVITDIVKAYYLYDIQPGETITFDGVSSVLDSINDIKYYDYDGTFIDKKELSETTAKVEISQINSNMTSYNNPRLVGKVTNTGSETIYNIGIEFTLYASEKKEKIIGIITDYILEDVESGKSSTFEAVYYDGNSINDVKYYDSDIVFLIK